MKFTSSIGLMMGVSLALFTACTTPDKGYFDDDDPEIVAAIAKARRTLPRFWKAFEQRNAGETDFRLKIKVTDGQRIEHFWLIHIAREERMVLGTIDPAPRIVSNVKHGERVKIPEAKIQDWFFVRNGKLVGAQTLRPSFKKMLKTMEMSEKDAAEIKAFLRSP